MKRQKGLILICAIALALAIVGYTFGSVSKSVANISSEDLKTLMCDRELALQRIQKISFVSTTFADPTYPQLEIELRNPKSRAIVIRPKLKQVELILEQSVAYGIDFDEVWLSKIEYSKGRRNVPLVRNGRRTKDYHCPPSFSFGKELPPDYLEYLRKEFPNVVRDLENSSR